MSSLNHFAGFKDNEVLSNQWAFIVYNVTDGFFTDTSPIRIWVIISNGRKNTGKFYESFHSASYFWNNTNIDSRQVEGVDPAVYQRIIV
jgi:hypothetical protein